MYSHEIGYYIVNRMFCCVWNTVKFRPSLIRKLRSPTDINWKVSCSTLGHPAAYMKNIKMLVSVVTVKVSACLVAGFVGRFAQWGRPNFVLPHWASCPSPVATRPSGHKKGFLGPAQLERLQFNPSVSPSPSLWIQTLKQTYFVYCVVLVYGLFQMQTAITVYGS